MLVAFFLFAHSISAEDYDDEDEDQDPDPAIVIDFGGGLVKAGFAGDDAPRVVFPPRGEPGKPGRPRRPSNAIEYGIVTNWTEFEQNLQHAFDELKVDSSKYLPAK